MMNHTRRTATAALLLSAFVGVSALAAKDDDKGKGGPDKDKDRGKGKGKAKHKDGKDLLGDKIKVNGKHKIAKNGGHTVSVEVKDGKIAAFQARHDTKGEAPIKKYKSNKKMVAMDAPASPFVLVQYRVGTTWIGFAYIDDWGYEEIYWYPYDIVMDGDTGAVEYVAVT